MPSRSPKPCSVLKTSLQISVCTQIRSKDSTLIEPPARTDCPGTSSSCQLRSKPLSGAQEVARQHIVHQQLFADAERVELLGGDRHQRARRTDDQRGHAGQPRGDRVRQRIAVERRHVGRQLAPVVAVVVAEVHEGQHDDAVLLARPRSRPDSRKRSASIDRMPVVRFSSSGTRAPDGPATAAATSSRRACRPSRAASPS